MYEAEIDMAAQMAKYADIVVAFNVLQALSFAYKLGQTKDDVRNAIVAGGRVISWVIILFGIAYEIVVITLKSHEWDLRNVAHQSNAVIPVPKSVMVTAHAPAMGTMMRTKSAFVRL
jgi:hypothetical protein